MDVVSFECAAMVPYGDMVWILTGFDISGDEGGRGKGGNVCLSRARAEVHSGATHALFSDE